MGFASSETVILRFFETIVERKNPGKKVTTELIREQEIFMPDFLGIFSDDDYQQKILNSLNRDIRVQEEIDDRRNKI